MTETTKPRILLVEDHMPWQITWALNINESISKYGLPPIEILQATNVFEAKMILKKAKPITNLYIVVLDYHLFLPAGSRRDAPGGNGAAFAKDLMRAGFSGTLIAAPSKEDLGLTPNMRNVRVLGCT